MRTRFASLALLIMLGLVVRVALPTGAADDKIDKVKVAKLIEQMGNGDFDEREKATIALEAIGLPALDALKKAAQSDDAEVRRRSTDLVLKIEKKHQAALILAPKKVHLVFKDTPVPEALADFSKKSGYTLNLLDPEGKLKDRKVTLDTGMVTFWQAFDQFCAKAGLVEADELDPAKLIPGVRPGIRIQPLPGNVLPIKPGELPPLPGKLQPEKDEAKQIQPPQKQQQNVAIVQFQAVQPVQVAQPGNVQVQVIGAPGGVVVGPGGFGNIAPNQPNQITVGDGTPKTLPTDAASAIRVKALDKAVQLGPVSEKEIAIGLKLSPEPRIQIQNILAVRVEKAMDDQDQRLMQAVGNAQPDPNVPVILPAVPIRRGQVWVGGTSPTTVVRLQKGTKASKELKELKGFVSAQVLAPPVATISVDKIMEAAGKAVKGAEGGQIKVTEVTKGANGRITIKFELEPTPNYFPANQNVPFNRPAAIGVGVPFPAPVPVPLPEKPAEKEDKLPQGAFRFPQPVQAQTVQIQAQVEIQVQPGFVGAGPAAFVPSTNGISLEDDKGNTIPCVGVNTIARRDPMRNVVVRENVMIFQPQKDQTPAKLLFSGSKSVSIDIPFTLKNVMLP